MGMWNHLCDKVKKIISIRSEKKLLLTEQRVSHCEVNSYTARYFFHLLLFLKENVYLCFLVRPMRVSLLTARRVCLWVVSVVIVAFFFSLFWSLMLMLAGNSDSYRVISLWLK